MSNTNNELTMKHQNKEEYDGQVMMTSLTATFHFLRPGFTSSSLAFPKHKIFLQSSNNGVFSRLMELNVKDLTVVKRRLVEVSDSATLVGALNTMVKHG